MTLPCRAVLATRTMSQPREPIRAGASTRATSDGCGCAPVRCRSSFRHGESEPARFGRCGTSSREREHVATMHLEPIGLNGDKLGAATESHLFRDGRRHHFFAIVTEIRLRPLARRRRSTSRPPRVFLRARKPCVRFRSCCGADTCAHGDLRGGGDTCCERRVSSVRRHVSGVQLATDSACGAKSPSDTNGQFSSCG